MLTTFLPASVQAVLTVPVAELSDEAINNILVDLGFGEWHPELRDAMIHLFRGRGIDTAADAIKQPEALMELRALIRGKETDLIPCSFCSTPFDRVSTDGFCPQCGILH